MAIQTDQGPEKRCGTCKTGPIVRLFLKSTIECSAIFLHVAVEICRTHAQHVTMAIRRTPLNKILI